MGRGVVVDRRVGMGMTSWIEVVFVAYVDFCIMFIL